MATAAPRLRRSLQHVSQLLGLDTRPEEYGYTEDARFGVMSRAKHPDAWVKTTCGYCSVGCGMLIGVRDAQAVSVRGDPDHPVNHGKLCPKGLSEHHTIHAEGRATAPLVKAWRGHKPVSWDEALTTMVDRVQGVQQRHGPQAFGVLSTGQMVSEELYALGKLVQLGFGTSNYDGNTTLCMATAVAGYKRSFGSDGPPGCYDDLEMADAVCLIGANIADNHPILAYRLFKNRDRGVQRGKLIVVDPRATKTAMLADLFLPIRPRSDIYLLNGIAHLMIREGWIDEAFLEAHTEGYDELRSHLDRFTPDYVGKVTDLGAGPIYEAAEILGTAESTFYGWTMGVNHSTQGVETVNAIANLSLLRGNVGKVGSAPFSITGQCNAMGSREASFSSSLPGYRKFESPADRAELAALWGVDVQGIPERRGLAYPDIIQAVLDGEIKALWIIATNPLVSFPHQARLREALAKLDFLVVQDGYHPTPTTELADLVLPAAIWGEKEGTYTNSERRVSKVNRAVTPPGEARSDFDIFLSIAERLGKRDRIYPGWTEPRDAFDEWRRVSKGRLCDYSGITYELLEHEPVQWPYPEGDPRPPYESRRLYADGRFEHHDGRARLFSVHCERPPEEPDDEYPFLLNTGRTVEHWHTRTKTGRVAILERSVPEAWVEINPKDARRLGVANHDMVRVRSRRGRIERIRARVTAVVAPGQVFIPFHFFETNANDLTLHECDPISREPNYKQSAVRLEAV